MPKTTISDEDLERTILSVTTEMGPFMKVEFPVDVRLGSANMTVDQLLRLSPGDVVSLDRVSSGYVEVMSESARRKCSCESAAVPRGWSKSPERWMGRP